MSDFTSIPVRRIRFLTWMEENQLLFPKKQLLEQLQWEVYTLQSFLKLIIINMANTKDKSQIKLVFLNNSKNREMQIIYST